MANLRISDIERVKELQDDACFVISQDKKNYSVEFGTIKDIFSEEIDRVIGKIYRDFDFGDEPIDLNKILDIICKQDYIINKLVHNVKALNIRLFELEQSLEDFD